MEINWTVLTYFVIGLFALSGFFKGWWKEAMTTILLAVLIFLLQNPDIAQLVIDAFNEILLTVWNFIPKSFQPTVGSTVDTAFAVDTRGRALQVDPGNPGTWLMLLILFIALATLFGRSTLPGGIIQNGTRYTTTPIGSVLGGLIGGLNGFLILNLVREYLDGRNLPGSSLSTEISSVGGERTLGLASSGVDVKAIQVPSFTLLDSFLPWIFIALGALIFLAVLRSRLGLHSQKGFRRIDYKIPYGYKAILVAPPKKNDKSA
jgi:uncharacterized membrane protein YkvI